MNSELYRAAAEDLRGNTEQWQAYESKGNCVILAGPGSGKTKTITTKVARLLAEEVNRPQRIACITYSNQCARELEARLERLGVVDRDPIVVSTVHSFALTQVVVPFAGLAGIATPSPLRVATPSESDRIFRQAFHEITKSTPGKWFRTGLDRLRREVPDKASADWLRVPTQPKSIIERYEQLLLAAGLIDFDGLILVGLEAIEKSEWVRSCLRAKFPVMVIDEYQDLGVPLHRMVLALMNRAGVRIIAVGDPDQSIYGFTGARPSLLRDLFELNAVEAVQLRLNYRCANRIIDASKALLSDPPETESPDSREGLIYIQPTGGGPEDQARHALETLIPSMLRMNPQWQPGDIAFLYRTFREGKAIANVAEEMEIPYFRTDSGVLVRRTRVVDFLTHAASWCAEEWGSGDINLRSILSGWRRLSPSETDESKALRERASLIRVLFASRNANTPLRTWLKQLYDVVLKDLFRAEPGLSDEFEAVKNLYKLTAPGEQLEAYTIGIFANLGRSPDQINLITLHSSKGLEFEAVVMLGLEEGEFPTRYAKTEEELEEAARLFYVGVTRAKSEVHLLYDTNESPLITSIRQRLE